MTVEEILALFTEEDRKVINEAKQAMEKIFFKLELGTDFDENMFISYLANCLDNAIIVIEEIEEKINEKRVTEKWYREGGNCSLSVS